jgi:UMP-CMP kinase
MRMRSLATRLGPLAGAAAGLSALLSTAASASAAAPAAAAEAAAPPPLYAYTPPLRQSAALQAAALAAARPRAPAPPPPVPRVLFVLGGPGTGKGTQCALLAARYGFVHLSAGDLLREERARGGPLADMIDATIRDGRIVPVEVTVGLLRAAMAASGSGKFLVDGFPRNFDNVRGWGAVIGSAAEVDGVLQFEAPEDVMVARLLERGKSSGRSDDNEESIRKRLRTHLESTVPGASGRGGLRGAARLFTPTPSPPLGPPSC